jgi:hypothetical protein
VPVSASLDSCAYMIAVCFTDRGKAWVLPGAQLYSMALDLRAGREASDPRDEIILGLQAELRSRTEWVMNVQRELEMRDGTIGRLQQEFEERTQWALELDRKVEEQAKEIEALRRGHEKPAPAGKPAGR